MLATDLTDRRRAAARAHPHINGIDWVETLDERTLAVHFLKALDRNRLTEFDVAIVGGEVPVPLPVERLEPREHRGKAVLHVRLARSGDRSTYTLRLVGLESSGPPRDFDPILSSATFRFVERERDRLARIDGAPGEPPVADAGEPAPEIDYLTKDYASFRRLMLDRVSLLQPRWQERNAADIGVMLVELLAYVGDYLSYRQDAIAGEAYITTARLRTSLRRHARLIDYAVDEGCTARTLVNVAVAATAGTLRLPHGTVLLSAIEGQAACLPTSTDVRAIAAQAGALIFETAGDAVLHGALAQPLEVYAWGERDYVLRAGATQATLLGRVEHLQRGDFILLRAQSDDSAERFHPVRLEFIEHTNDPIGGRFHEPPSDRSVALTHIGWAAGDALPTEFVVARRVDDGEDVRYETGRTVAIANTVPADCGSTVYDEPLEAVDAGLYRPVLAHGPLTFAAVPPAGACAADVLTPSTRPRPQIQVMSALAGRTTVWNVRSDLVESDAYAADFAVETETDGSTTLRFGDDVSGRRPEIGAALRATYRIGNGPDGNLSARSIGHIITDDPRVTGVFGPLAAGGGSAPESADRIRENAPFAFREQARAVTSDDYAAAVRRHPAVLDAAAEFTWTGSWRSARVTVDLRGGAALDPRLRGELQQRIDAVRLVGVEAEIRAARRAPIAVTLRVDLAAGYRRHDVRTALAAALRGAFEPDNFRLGQPVYVSAIVALACNVPGVANARVERLQRLDEPGAELPASNVLSIAAGDKIQLDNDARYPDRGYVQIEFGLRERT